MSKGRLISFEGLDGSGKTTQMDLLEGWLKRRRIPYERTREPGGTQLGLKIRDLLLNHPELTITPLAEVLLFEADRAQHFARKILPALEEGKLIVTDRCLDATIAYQGFAHGVDVDLVKRLSMLVTWHHSPDLTILLDLNPAEVQMRTDVANRQNDEIGVARQLRFPFYGNRFDTEEEKFHRRVREGFLHLARSDPNRIKLIDASLSKEEIHQEIITYVELLLQGLSLRTSSHQVKR